MNHNFWFSDCPLRKFFRGSTKKGWTLIAQFSVAVSHSLRTQQFFEFTHCVKYNSSLCQKFRKVSRKSPIRELHQKCLKNWKFEIFLLVKPILTLLSKIEWIETTRCKSRLPNGPYCSFFKNRANLCFSATNSQNGLVSSGMVEHLAKTFSPTGRTMTACAFWSVVQSFFTKIRLVI